MALHWSFGHLQPKLWAKEVPGLQPGKVSGFHLGSPGKKSHLDVASTERCREYYMGEGGGFPRVWGVVSLVCQSAYGLSQHLSQPHFGQVCG